MLEMDLCTAAQVADVPNKLFSWYEHFDEQLYGIINVIIFNNLQLFKQFYAIYTRKENNSWQMVIYHE